VKPQEPKRPDPATTFNGTDWEHLSDKNFLELEKALREALRGDNE